MQTFLIKNKNYILIVFISLLIAAGGVSFGIYEYNQKPECDNKEEPVLSLTTEEEVTTNNRSFYVEVKGAVKNPGVYEVSDGDIIDNLIKKAGGFKSTSYTDNINLSKKLTEEMVVYVYTKSAYKKLNADTSTSKAKSSETKNSTDTACITSTYTIDNCTDNSVSVIASGEVDTVFATSEDTDTVFATNEDTVTTSNSIININTASLSELMTLSGIGEAKAQNIITYREENGSFKTTEDIKNVSGIGDAAYEKIKEYITV